MKKENRIFLILFILGIFIGAMDSGIVSPARLIIENGFGVDQNAGIWMITLYTLIYAAFMPILGKLADRLGYRKVYLFGIVTFGIGSAMSGLTNFFGDFWLFLLSRAIQAFGAGGILPIATTAVSKIFPEEKKGTALGIVGGVYGIATIIGPTLGSFILSISGNSNWGWLFFINIPITIAVVVLATRVGEIPIEGRIGKLDVVGSVLLAATVGSLMYALTNFDFFNIAASLANAKVYPFLIVFAVLLPTLFTVERKVSDPVFNVKYLTDRKLSSIMLLAFVVGVGMMGLIFIPQFSENILKIPAGTGGYVVTLLAVFSGIAAPLSGILLDRYGARSVLLFGFLFSSVGTLFLGYVTTTMLNFTGLFIGLVFLGVGVGFTLGAPLNYLILEAVEREDSASGLANMSLMRSVGVTVAPNVMVGFLVQSGRNLQTNLMGTLSGAGLKMPTNLHADQRSKALFASLQNANVTNIVEKLKNVLGQVIPFPLNRLVDTKIQSVHAQIQDTFQSTVNTGYTEMFFTAAVFALIGLAVTLFLRNPKKKQKEELHYAEEEE